MTFDEWNECPNCGAPVQFYKQGKTWYVECSKNCGWRLREYEAERKVSE